MPVGAGDELTTRSIFPLTQLIERHTCQQAQRLQPLWLGAVKELRRIPLGQKIVALVRPSRQLMPNPPMAKQNNEPSNNESGAFDERLLSYAQRADVAQGKAAQAFGRLLSLAETRDSGQAHCIAQFIAATYNGVAFKFDLFDMRVLDVQISDDMLAALDALRWGKTDLFRLVPEGDKRGQAVIALWNLLPVT